MGSGLWKLASAEVQGSGHKKKNIPCQDKTYCIQRNKVRAIALADGAGSASLSHLGAAAITEAVSEHVVNNFNKLFMADESDVLDEVVRVIRNTLSIQASRLECPEKELSSTLLFAAVKKGSYLALHIGDGVIGSFERNSLRVLSAPENGEYANMTWFTTTKNLKGVTRLYRGDASSISGFILMSDGVEASLYDPSENRLADAVTNLFYTNAKIDSKQMQPMLEECLEHVVSPRTHDDCSIALLSRTRFKKFQEYSKYRRMVVKRYKAARKSR